MVNIKEKRVKEKFQIERANDLIKLVFSKLSKVGQF